MADKAFVFGDVHGEAKLLAQLIAKVRERFGEDIDLYSVGDLVDRGPDSKGVLDLCVGEGVQGILGNHELWLHQLLATGTLNEFSLHPSMKGGATISSYGLNPACGLEQIAKDLPGLIPEAHKEYILGLPVWRRIEYGGEVFRLIHSGLKTPDVRKFRQVMRHSKDGDELLDQISNVLPSVLMWSSPDMRNPNLHRFGDGPQVFGHRPVRTPIINQDWMALDTGCGTCPPYTLSGVVLPDREIVQANDLTGFIKPGEFSDW